MSEKLWIYSYSYLYSYLYRGGSRLVKRGHNQICHHALLMWARLAGIYSLIVYEVATHACESCQNWRVWGMSTENFGQLLRLNSREFLITFTQ